MSLITEGWGGGKRRVYRSLSGGVSGKVREWWSQRVVELVVESESSGVSGGVRQW